MRRFVPFALAVGFALASATPAGAAGNPFGVDFHANCTGGFAVSQTLGGEPGATELATIAQPPPQPAARSVAGTLSSTDCGG
jgi:hypothetical protein